MEDKNKEDEGGKKGGSDEDEERRINDINESVEHGRKVNQMNEFENENMVIRRRDTSEEKARIRVYQWTRKRYHK